MPRKVRNVPQVAGIHIEHYQFLQELRDAVVQLQSSSLPPDDPRNLTVTPFATGNNVQWTRSNNAQRYTVYIADALPTMDAGSATGSIAIDVGDTNYFNDVVGQSNWARWYWVKAWNGNVGSRTIGPVKGTTAASGSVADPPKQVPPGVVTIDQTTGLKITGRPGVSPGRGPTKL
jgi:hypothetical protein